MYDQIREDTLFIILYSVVTAMAMMASCYLVLNHVVYMPIFFLSSSEDIMTIDLIGGFLDCMTLFPVAIIVLFAMLQDRRRPLWPVAAMFVPLVVGGAFGVAVRSYVLLPVVYVYFLLMCIGLIIYMVRALRQYGRWLRDNYADLEHKEVWQSFVVLAIILLVFVIYVFTSEGTFYQYAMQVIVLVLPILTICVSITSSASIARLLLLIDLSPSCSWHRRVVSAITTPLVVPSSAKRDSR